MGTTPASGNGYINSGKYAQSATGGIGATLVIRGNLGAAVIEQMPVQMVFLSATVATGATCKRSCIWPVTKIQIFMLKICLLHSGHLLINDM